MQALSVWAGRRRLWLPWTVWERAAELLAEYQSWLRRFAAAFRLPVLDFDRAFTRWGEEGLFQPDGLHPNAAGHCLMAETAAALIRSL